MKHNKRYNMIPKSIFLECKIYTFCASLPFSSLLALHSYPSVQYHITTTIFIQLFFYSIESASVETVKSWNLIRFRHSKFTYKYAHRNILDLMSCCCVWGAFGKLPLNLLKEFLEILIWLFALLSRDIGYFA